MTIKLLKQSLKNWYNFTTRNSQSDSSMVLLDQTRYKSKRNSNTYCTDVKILLTSHRIAVACVGPAHNNPYLFRSYDPNDAGVKYDQSHTPTVSIPTWQVARALIAAPKYFPPIEIGDCEFSGGRKELCYASVPVFHEVRRRVEEPSDKNMLFISIGSGNYNGLKFEMQGLSSVTGFMGDTTNVKPRGNFYRFNPPLKRIRYDEWRKIKGVDGNATINQITHETESYLADPRVRESLREIAIGLVQNRRARSEKRNIERYNSLRDV